MSSLFPDKRPPNIKTQFESGSGSMMDQCNFVISEAVIAGFGDQVHYKNFTTSILDKALIKRFYQSGEQFLFSGDALP